MREQDPPEAVEVEGLDGNGEVVPVFEVVDVGDGEVSVAIIQNDGQTHGFTSNQVDDLIETLRRANGGE